MAEQRLTDVNKLMSDYGLSTDCKDCKRKGKQCDSICLMWRDVCEMLDDAPAVDAVPIDRLADLLERWNWACAICTHSVDCDKCGLNRCIDELKEIINSVERKGR